MQQPEWLAERFEENRGHLRAVAYRMLGSLSEADDAVQEAWLRLSRSEASGIDNLGGWLTTVVWARHKPCWDSRSKIATCDSQRTKGSIVIRADSRRGLFSPLRFHPFTHTT